MTDKTRKFLGLAVLALLVFGLLAAAMWHFAWKPYRYESRKQGFAITFSPEWEVLGEGEGADVRAVRTLGVKDGGATGVINVLVNPVMNFSDAPAFREWFGRFAATNSNYTGYARVQEGSRMIPEVGEAPWTMFVYQQKDAPRMQVWQVFLVRGQNGYVISCTATPFAFEKFRPEFEAAVDSFRFK